MRQIDLNNKTILITGALEDWGAYLMKHILEEAPNASVIGVGFGPANGSHNRTFGEGSLGAAAADNPSCTVIWDNIADKAVAAGIFERYRPDIVVFLAPDVCHAAAAPGRYVDGGVIGFCNILEAIGRFCGSRLGYVWHTVFVFCSAVYGVRKWEANSLPDPAVNPYSLSAAAELAEELLAYAYSRLCHMPVTGLRFVMDRGKNVLSPENRAKLILQVMQEVPESCFGRNGTPEPPYALRNVGDGGTEDYLDASGYYRHERIWSAIIPPDYYFRKSSWDPGGDSCIPGTEPTSGTREITDTTLRDDLRRFSRWYAAF